MALETRTPTSHTCGSLGLLTPPEIVRRFCGCSISGISGSSLHRYYTQYIKARDDWEFVKVYTDEERSYPELFKGIETERKLGSMPYRYHKYDLYLG